MQSMATDLGAQRRFDDGRKVALRGVVNSTGRRKPHLWCDDRRRSLYNSSLTAGTGYRREMDKRIWLKRSELGAVFTPKPEGTLLRKEPPKRQRRTKP